jgi:hypothetical protein
MTAPKILLALLAAWYLLAQGPGSRPGTSVYFTDQTSVKILGTSSLIGTAEVVVACYEPVGGNLWQQVVGGVTVNNLTYDVTISFAVPQSGFCVLK